MPLLAIIGGLLTKFLTDKLLFYVAIKALLVGLFMIVLPWVLKETFVWLMTKVMELVTSNLDGYSTQFQEIAISLTGVGAYLGDCFQLPLVFSLILSAIFLRMTLNFIPFIR